MAMVILMLIRIRATDGTSSMTIDSSGRILTPDTRPSFCARPMVAQSHNQTSGDIIFGASSFEQMMNASWLS